MNTRIKDISFVGYFETRKAAASSKPKPEKGLRTSVDKKGKCFVVKFEGILNRRKCIHVIH